MAGPIASGPDQGGSPGDASGVRYFPKLGAGLGRDPATLVRGLCTSAFKLAVDGRAFIEDIEGGAEQPELVAALRWRLAEFLVEVDLILEGVCPVDEWHHAALAMEYGLGGLAAVDGEALARHCGLGDDGRGNRAGSTAPLLAFWEGLVDAFPGGLPNPLEPTGQGELLRALRHWSKLCDAVGIPADFLQALLQEV